jgi:hypothetical protein
MTPERLMAIQATSRQLQRLQAKKQGERASKKSRNVGRTHDVVDNKEPVLVTHDIYENTQLKPYRPRYV